MSGGVGLRVLVGVGWALSLSVPSQGLPLRPFLEPGLRSFWLVIWSVFRSVAGSCFPAGLCVGVFDWVLVWPLSRVFWLAPRSAFSVEFFYRFFYLPPFCPASWSPLSLFSDRPLRWFSQQPLGRFFSLFSDRLLTVLGTMPSPASFLDAVNSPRVSTAWECSSWSTLRWLGTRSWHVLTTTPVDLRRPEIRHVTLSKNDANAAL